MINPYIVLGLVFVLTLVYAFYNTRSPWQLNAYQEQNLPKDYLYNSPVTNIVVTASGLRLLAPYVGYLVRGNEFNQT